jgi:3-oxoadipate CoA-transferase, alpha subunit
VLDKRVDSAAEAVADIADGARIMIGGFGDVGVPSSLVEAVLAKGVSALEVIANNAGTGNAGLAALIRAGRVRRLYCSYPRDPGSATFFEEAYRRGEIELELVPQGTLSERIRAAGAGIGGFFTRTGAGTLLAEGKEARSFDGHEYILELPLRADFALIRGRVADRWGNLCYRATARNFGPSMAMAAAVTIAEVESIVEIGALSPEEIVTPGIFIDRIVLYQPGRAQ